MVGRRSAQPYRLSKRPGWPATVRPTGRPHSAPIWHIWTDGCAYVVTKDSAVKVENIRHHSSVVLTHPDPHKAIIIEGKAQIVEGKTDMLRPLNIAGAAGWNNAAAQESTSFEKVQTFEMFLEPRRSP